ncbi:uncharacterized protein LOC134586415 isoform X2 [Pelobates fuscus]|uniref:uncharacterized protein LOC134586415 isoform X2 n=1 Tax=Pelobates fuscus TaxID=191477 RepID=UPI002FE4E423
MSSPMYQVSVTFHDVAACFSAEEWGLLEEWQKELYKNVMRDIHEALQAMGFEIINPDVLFRIKKVKDNYTSICDFDGSISSAACPSEELDHLMAIKQEHVADQWRRKGTRPCQVTARSPDILLRIKQGDQSALSDFSESSSTLSPSEPVVTSVFSLQMEKEKKKELHPAHRPDSQTAQLQKPFPCKPLKQEEVDYVKVSVGSSTQDSMVVNPRERFSSHPIKQEEVEYVKVSVGGSTQDSTVVSPRDTADAPSQVSDTGTMLPPKENDIPYVPECHPKPSPSHGAHRVRKYTDRELEVLVNMVMENYPKLFGKESATTTVAAKDAIWQAIADGINALGVDFRTTEKVRKRWMNAKLVMKRKVKEAAQHEAETGRRPPPYLRLTSYEQRLRDFFMPEFSKKVQWVRNEANLPEEESGPLEVAESVKIVPDSPTPLDTEYESGNKSSEEPAPTSPGPEIQISDQLEEQDGLAKTNLQSDEHKEESSEDNVEDLCEESLKPNSFFSHQLLLKMQDKQFSSINVTLCRQSSTLETISSHQRESNILMQEQNSILSQIAYSLNLLQIQQTDGLATLGSIIQKGIDALKPTSIGSESMDSRSSVDTPNFHRAVWRQMTQFPRPSIDQTTIPPKRKIT